ncbi:hypothetical protein Scep_009822 [Stephania cephalantha]|uniref:FAE domain-containing protein n=1 Tax=Stephania cephalantha TaxID=152367 RepID=A0AAP0PGM3_9MAGN
MLLANCLFRMGAAAILLSNCRSHHHCSKYQVIHTVCTHKGNNDKCFNCVYQEEDDNGCIGVSLSKDLMVVAGEDLKEYFTTMDA